MKKIIAVIIGATLSFGIGVILTSTASNWLASEFVRSDDDMNLFGKIILFGVYPAFMIFGGWLGYAFQEKKLNNRKQSTR